MALVRTKSGRRYSDRRPNDDGHPGQSSEPDPRALLPLAEREHTKEQLDGGTTLISYRDRPLGAPPLIDLPDELDEEDAPQTWRTDAPTPPKSEGLDRWEGPIGPLRRRK